MRKLWHNNKPKQSSRDFPQPYILKYDFAHSRGQIQPTLDTILRLVFATLH